MKPRARATPDVEAAGCPLLHPVDATGPYNSLGSCTGLPHGLLMIPTVEEYRSLCCTPAHVLCPVYRSRIGQDCLETWLRAEHDSWALLPLDGPCSGASSASSREDPTPDARQAGGRNQPPEKMAARTGVGGDP
jgi:hypothetical protein